MDATPTFKNCPNTYAPPCSFFVLSHELLVVWPLFDLSHFFLFALFFLFVLYHCNIQGPRAHQVISYQLISMGTYVVHMYQAE